MTPWSELTAREPKGAAPTGLTNEERARREGGASRAPGGERDSRASGRIEPARLQPAIRHRDGISFLRGLAGTRVRQNGCAAAAYAALYANVDVITAYPIRPYTAIMMNLAQFVADGILDAEYIHADGEHSQFSAAFGAGSCGARAYTGSSGVGVTYGYEMYSIISGARIPIQMAIADRTLDPPGDFGSEHTDALCTREMAPVGRESFTCVSRLPQLGQRIGAPRLVYLRMISSENRFPLFGIMQQF